MTFNHLAVPTAMSSSGQKTMSDTHLKVIDEKLACFICSGCPLGKLRNVFTNNATPDSSSVYVLLLETFDIELYLEKENVLNYKICLTCKNRLMKCFEFRKSVESALQRRRPHLQQPAGHNLPVKREQTPSPSTMLKGKERIPKCSTQLNFPSNTSNQAVNSFDESPCDHTYACTATPEEQAIVEVHSSQAQFFKGTASLATLEDKDTLTKQTTRVESPCDHTYSYTTTPKEQAIAKVHLSQARFFKKATASLLTLEDKDALTKQTTYEGVAETVARSTNIMAAVHKRLLVDINSMCHRLCSLTYEPGPSVLRSLQSPNMLRKEDVLMKSLLELQNYMPFVHDILQILASPPEMQKPNTNDTVATMYAMAMHNRNKDLCAVQKLNTCVALRYHADNNLLDVFHKCGITMAGSSKYHFLDELGRFNMDGIMKSIAVGKPGKLPIDNIDGMLVANQVCLGDGKKHDRYTASAVYPDRSDTSHMTMASPISPDEVDNDVFYLTEDEETNLKTMYGYMLSSLDKAKLDLLGAYTINSLFWMYLNTKGETSKEQSINEELDRVRSYMRRLKETQDKEKAPRLNKDTTQRFGCSALWQLAHNKPIPEHLVQPPETAGTSQDESGSAPAVAAEGGEREGHVKRARKSQGDVKRARKSQGDVKRARKSQGDVKRALKSQGDVKRARKSQGDVKKCKKLKI